ncbi:fungal-specific transcription factor domain-containing protein, partial [Mycotypha africana]|uniref:fungal-specific transcription factor domain-containing protein n=1 Tax=Mycotypha africana TaxID=64632 RepID=UPI0023018C77
VDDNGHVRYLGRSSGFYLLADSRTYQNGAFHFSGYAHKLKINTKKEIPIDPFELPPKDLSEHLINLYFTHFYPVLPMFYKKRLVCSLSPLETVSPLLLNAVYALASRVSSDERVRSDPSSPDTAGDIFFERARCLLDDYYDTPKISTVQALLLMTSHQMGTMKSPRAWLYSGMAFRMAQDLGLNRNCDNWSNITPEERERRKRVFWCCYMVDRIISAIYGRSSNFEERDCDVPFPSVDDDEPITCKNGSRPPASLLELFIQHIKVCDILGHVLKNIYYARAKQHQHHRHSSDTHSMDHILRTLHRHLIQWHSNLPASLQYELPNTQNGEVAPDPPSAICQLHLMYYTTLILLHRSFIPGPSQKQLPITLPSYKICESAATSVLDIVQIMLAEDHLRYVYNFAVFYVFTAGIIFIKLASSLDPDRAFDAKININRIMRALDELEKSWMNAARCSNILGELAGLRDIRLECNKYVPDKETKPSTPPPFIGVPNSPEPVKDEDIEDEQLQIAYSVSNVQRPPSSWVTESVSPSSFLGNSSSNAALSATQIPISSVRQSIQNHQRTPSSDMLPPRTPEVTSNFDSGTPQYYAPPAQQAGITPAMDPFAAPGIIPGPNNQSEEFDPLATAFWGMPSSLNTDEWNTYFDTLQQQ